MVRHIDLKLNGLHLNKNIECNHKVRDNEQLFLTNSAKHRWFRHFPVWTAVLGIYISQHF